MKKKKERKRESRSHVVSSAHTSRKCSRRWPSHCNKPPKGMFGQGRGVEGRDGLGFFCTSFGQISRKHDAAAEMKWKRNKETKKVGAAFQRCPRLGGGGRGGGKKTNKTGSNGERRRAKRSKHVIVSPGRSDTNRPPPVAFETLACQVMLRCRCMQSHEPMLIWGGRGRGRGRGFFL